MIKDVLEIKLIRIDDYFCVKFVTINLYHIYTNL